MERRQLLLGIGAAATASGVAVGSGAYDSLEATRSADVGLVDDSSGLLTLDAGESTLVEETEAGTLDIDLSEMNFDSVLTLDPAFTVENGVDEEIDLTADIELSEQIESDQVDDVYEATELVADEDDETQRELIPDSEGDDGGTLEMEPAGSGGPDDDGVYPVELTVDGELLADAGIDSGTDIIEELGFTAEEGGPL